MYKYQCSRNECGSTWSLHEGKLNGFVLTCPICSKGRGIFVSQTPREISKFEHEDSDEIVISIGSESAKPLEELNRRIDDFIQKHSLLIVSKDLKSIGKDLICTVKYKTKNQ